MKILAIFVLYHPEEKLLSENLKHILPYVDEAILWNNSLEVAPCPYKGTDEHIIYINEGRNVGLPKAYNYAWEYARKKGYTHILTMDQDSVFVDFQKMISLVEKHAECAIYGPYVPSPGTPKLQESCQECLHIINSGAIIPVEILNHTKGYAEDFFLDMVDDEFCYHARSLGYKVYQFRDCVLKQQYGAIQEIKVCRRRLCRTINYSPMRIYGICRNKLVLWKKYDVPVWEKRKVLVADIKAFIKMLLFEKKKFRKTKAYFLGYIDGIRGAKSRISQF